MSTSPHTTASLTTCPECAATLHTDPRFPLWCPTCEWNLSPAAGQAPHGSPKEQRRAARQERSAAARRATVRARAEKLYESLANGAEQSLDLEWLAAAAIAGLVHLVTLSVFAGSTALLFTGFWPLRILGVIGLGLSYVLRPRFGRLKNSTGALLRSEAPALYGLADRVARTAGGRPVNVIRLTGAFNASFSRVGLRRRRVLTLGLPLWTPLDAQQRVALLGHEFGHDVNGDHRRGLWLGTALNALAEWCHITRPNFQIRAAGLMYFTIQFFNILLWLVHWTIGQTLALLDRLTTRSGQAAEYRADAFAARIASTSAAQSMLATLLLSQSAQTVLSRYRNRSNARRSIDQAPAADLWTELTEQLTTVPAYERERLLRRSALELGTVDATHPPTHLRIRLLDRHPVPEPALLLEAAELAAIDAELAPYRAGVSRQLLAG